MSELLDNGNIRQRFYDLQSIEAGERKEGEEEVEEELGGAGVNEGDVKNRLNNINNLNTGVIQLKPEFEDSMLQLANQFENSLSISDKEVSKEENMLQFDSKDIPELDKVIRNDLSPRKYIVNADRGGSAKDGNLPAAIAATATAPNAGAIENNDNQQNQNLSWLPSLLKDEWPDDEATNKSKSNPSSNNFDGYYYGDDDDNNNNNNNFTESVLIHRSVAGSPERQPDWKRAAIDAQQRRINIQPKLNEYFIAPESLKTSNFSESNNNINFQQQQQQDQRQLTIDSSAFNTAFKLFGQHNSFTQNKLNQIIDDIENVNKLKETPDKNNQISDNPNFHYESSQTEDYLKNAEALFANLKSKGAPDFNPQALPQYEVTTTTDSSSSMDLYPESQDQHEMVQSVHELEESKDDTESSTSSGIYHTEQSIDHHNSIPHKSPDQGNYTETSESFNDSEDYQAETFPHGRSDEIFINNHYEEEEEEEEEEEQKSDISHLEDLKAKYNTTFPLLQEENKIQTPKLKNVIYRKPTLIKPEDFGMELDKNKKEWIVPEENNEKLMEDKENDERVAALNAINDLTTMRHKNNKQINNKDFVNDSKRQNSSILKSATPSILKSRDTNSKLEVSFRVPSGHKSRDGGEGDDDKDDTFHNRSQSKSKSFGFDDITHASQLEDISFSESKKKLISVLTIVEPSGNWDEILELNLSDLGLEHLKDFYKFIPNLKEIDLSNNNIKFVNDLPTKIQKLILKNNALDGLCSFEKFHDLHYLDISSNSFDKIIDLNSLYNITNIIASSNVINSLDGLNSLGTLIELDLSNNKLRGKIDFNQFKLPNLQNLNLSGNEITHLKGLSKLTALVTLRADENNLETIEFETVHMKLKKICLEMNNLKELNCEFFPNLRVLRIDGNDIIYLSGCDKLKYLEELSAKSQQQESIINEIIEELNDVKMLDLAGTTSLRLNQFKSSFSNVTSLNLSAMNIEKLPFNFHEIFCNVRDLNLNFNKLTDISSLKNLNKLKNLYLVSNNLKDLESLVDALSGSRKFLKRLDLRLNPINKGYYPYVFSPHESDSNKISGGTSTRNYQGNHLISTEVSGDENYTLIQLDTLDDIKSFTILYNALVKNGEQDNSDWVIRDRAFVNNLKIEHTKKSKNNNEDSLYIRRKKYETIMLRLCGRIGFFDGRLIKKEDMIDAKIMLQEMSSGNSSSSSNS
ncbi:hypothetical protein PACTADRAFT_50048 [Pachysolen tannophilus NRRL Y-2460]|uniref:Septation initiation network scaffold protein cdc11 n=1 Tax=Pachysolen tannophilus NRRL Y-2460 TaxID=669874 RepID=A0A1E4TU94_PACTA|nr:hypothetical protein PACTADRAFT_50048 [Pachysolen tannophilus NRRL Y-2460]